jgi:hypothetical protein
VEGALNFMVIQRDIWGLGGHPPADGTSLWWPTEFEFQPGILTRSQPLHSAVENNADRK